MLTFSEIVLGQKTLPIAMICSFQPNSNSPSTPSRSKCLGHPFFVIVVLIFCLFSSSCLRFHASRAANIKHDFVSIMDSYKIYCNGLFGCQRSTSTHMICVLENNSHDSLQM